MAITPLVGKAYAEKKGKEIVELFQNSFLFVIIMAVLIMIILLLAYFFMDYMGQQISVVELAKPYYILLIISLFPFLMFSVYKQFVEGLGNTAVAMYITIIANIININPEPKALLSYKLSVLIFLGIINTLLFKNF